MCNYLLFYAALKIVSLVFMFAILIIMCFGVDLFGLILFWTLLFPGPGYKLSQAKEVFIYYVFKYVLCSFLLLFTFWVPYNVNTVSSLHTNLQVVNFQRYKRAFTCPIT